MKKSLLIAIGATLIAFCTIKASAQSAPYFTGGATNTLSVCENSSATAINTLLAVMDSNTAETEIWSAVITPAHGTLAAAYTTTSTGSTLTPSGLSYTPTTGYSGPDTFSVQVSDGALMDTITIYVTVRPLPSAGTISGASSVCVGSSITLTSTGTGGSWSSSNATANITGGGLVTGLAAGIDTITYFVVNSCGVAYATKIITVNPLPHAGTITAASSVCVTASISVSSTTTGGTWGLSNSNATLSGTTITGVTAGMDTLTYIVTTVCGSDTAMRAISINPLPVAGTITGASVVCEAASIADTASVSGGTWSASNTNATVSGGVITGAVAGMDTILYTVTNSCGAVSATHPVTINPLPVTGSLSGASSVCVGASITLSATIAGGAWSRSNTAASLSDSVVTGVTPGMDTIMYSFANACGTRSALHTVTVMGAPHAGPITGLDRVCLGSSIVLSAPVSGTWIATNGSVSLSGDTVTGVAYGRDTIMNIASNACGTDTAYHFDRVDTAAPHASMITGPFIVCVNDTIRVADSAAGGIWRMSNAHAVINTTGRIRGNSAGIDTVIYRIANGCGADTAYYTVTINPLPHAGAITGYDSVCVSSSILLHDAGTGGSWISDNPVFADVDTAGRVYGYLHGSVNIYYIVSNSCGSDSAVHPVNVNVPAQPILGLPTLCQGATSILIDPIPGGTWSTALAGIFVVGPAIGGTLIGITTGTATVTYTLHNACGTSTATFDVTVVVCPPAGVAEVKNTTTTLSIVPNPNQGNFTISLPTTTDDVAQIVVTNMMGQQIKEFQIGTKKPTEVALNIPAGVYLLSATINNTKYTTRVVITE